MPKLKNPVLVCDILHKVWNTNTRNGSVFRKDFSILSTNVGYFGAIKIEVDKHGKVIKIDKPNDYMKFDNRIYIIFSKFISHFTWYPAYNKKGKSKLFSSRKIMIYFSVDLKYKLSLRFSDVSTGYNIFMCEK